MTKNIILFSLFIFSDFTIAEPRQFVEDMFSNEGTWTSTLSINYSVSDAKKSEVNSISITTEDGVVEVPFYAGEIESEQEVVSLSPQMKYGVNDQLTVNLINTFLYTSNKLLNSDGGTSSSTDYNFAESSLGFSYKVLEENASPSVSLSFDLVLVDKNGFDSTNYLSGFSASLSLYRTLDPVVLSLNSGYRYNSKRDIKKRSVEIPDTIFINPSVTFLANPQISMAFGPDIRYREETTINNRTVEVSGIDMRAVSSVTYAFNSDTRIFFETAFNMVGDGQSNIGLSIVNEF